MLVLRFFRVAAAVSAPALALCLVAGLATTAAAQVRFWQDPVVTYTNGMRLASTASQRSHHAYWRCDPDRVGYCDGRMYGASKNDLRSLGTRRRGCYCFPSGPPPGPVGSAAPHATDGLETGDGERIGTLRFVPEGVPGTARLTSATLPAPAPTLAPVSDSERTWFDELQRLGDKMEITGSATLP